MDGHHLLCIRNQEEARAIMEKIGADPGSYPYMVPKAIHRCIKLKNINGITANILKQEMLSRGGEAAISREALHGRTKTDVLLMGTLKQYHLLIEKLKQQPLGLRKLSEEIKGLLDNMEPGIRNIDLANGKQIELGKRTLIIGILNVTPDSFSDGGAYLDPEQAVAHAYEMIEQGADIIDIGGASSRPDSTMADEEDELNRILPVLHKLSREDIIISLDTFRGNVARVGLENGVNIINDIGNLQLDANMLPVLVEKQAPVIIMHNRLQINRGQAYNDIICDIIQELGESIHAAEEAGLAKDKIIIDPGIGFGKSPEENMLIIKQLQAFKALGAPVLIGMSRKSFIGNILDVDVNERLEGSLGVMAISVMNGADIVRVHDVKESKRVAQIVDAVVR